MRAATGVWPGDGDCSLDGFDPANGMPGLLQTSFNPPIYFARAVLLSGMSIGTGMTFRSQFPVRLTTSGR
jgi:hypothetical protein